MIDGALAREDFAAAALESATAGKFAAVEKCLISEEEAEGGVGVREEEIAAAEPDDAQANDEPADDASEETQDEPSDESGEGAEEMEAKEEESS